MSETLTPKALKELFQAGHEIGLELEKEGKVQTLGSMGAKYLPWATLWRAARKLDPIGDLAYKVLTKGDMCEEILGSESLEVTLPAGTGFEIAVELTWLGKSHITRLAITDHNHKCVTNPTSVHVQNTRQRCLAKAISEATGIGLHLWDGEDLEQYKSTAPSKSSYKKSKPAPAPVDADAELDAIFAEAGVAEEQEAPKPTVRMASAKQVGLIVSKDWMPKEEASQLTSQEASAFISEMFAN